MTRLDTTPATQVRQLQATDLASIDFLVDTRGHAVVDMSGEKVGRVDALFIDDGQRKVRFLRAAPDWPAEAGTKKFLFPVDTILLIRGATIYLDRRRDALAAAPREDRQLGELRNLEFVYEHYGMRPFWHEAYEYPPYPFYL